MGTLDSAHLAADMIHELGIRQAVLSRLTRIPSSVLSAWLAGVREIGASRERVVIVTLRDIKNLADISPWAIGLDDPDLLEDSLRRLRAGEFEPYRALCATQQEQTV